MKGASTTQDTNRAGETQPDKVVIRIDNLNTQETPDTPFFKLGAPETPSYSNKGTDSFKLSPIRMHTELASEPEHAAKHGQ